MPQLTGAAFDAVKAVVLTGDPFHKAGLSCNVDENGGTTTLNDNGISEYQGVSIPSNWISKSLDICYKVSSRSSFHSHADSTRAMVFATLKTVV